jgi:hypothetical protein
MTPMPLQSLHAHTVLSLLSFSTLRPLRDFVFLPFSLRWRIWMPSWLSFSLKQPLAECFRVFSNPVKIPQWILLQITELKEFSSPVPVCTLYSMPTWQSIFSQNFSSFVLLCTYAPLNAHLAELSESSVILFLS